MPANDKVQPKLSSSPLQQQAQMSLQQQQLENSIDTLSTLSTTIPSSLNAEFFHCLTQNLLATTAAGTSGQPQAADAATTEASVATAFGLALPDVSMIYGNFNLYNLFNLNLLTESQQSQLQSSSLLTEYLRQRTVEANARQHQQRQQRPSKEKKRVRKIFDKNCEKFLRLEKRRYI